MKSYKSAQNDGNFLRSELDKSVDIMKATLPFLETWYAASHNSLGHGCLDIINKIKDFLDSYDQD